MSTENIVTLFKNANGNCNVALASGQVVAFIEGKFFTTDKRLEAQLQDAADRGEFGVFVDRNESSIDTEAATPMEQLRKKIRAELMLEMQQTKLGESSSYSQQTAQAQRAIGGTDLVIGAGIETPQNEALKDASVPVVKVSEVSDPIKPETVIPAPTPEDETKEELSALQKLELLKAGKPA